MPKPDILYTRQITLHYDDVNGEPNGNADIQHLPQDNAKNPDPELNGTIRRMMSCLGSGRFSPDVCYGGTRHLSRRRRLRG
eukprot:2432245-Rhodomonas_salina.1